MSARCDPQPEGVTPLIVIDVQEKFKIAGLVEEGVLEQVEIAKESRMPVVLVEFVGYSRTLAPISGGLSGYPLLTKVRKDTRDGSEPIAKRLWNKWRIAPPSEVRVCGVYCSHCVNDTAMGLHGMGFRVSVIEDAVDRYGWGAANTIEHWRKAGNISVITGRKSPDSPPVMMAKYLIRHRADRIIGLLHIIDGHDGIMGIDGVRARMQLPMRVARSASELGLVELDGEDMTCRITTLGSQAISVVDGVRGYGA